MLIHDAFKYCGLNPWSGENSMKAFKEHLDDLESNNILKAIEMVRDSSGSVDGDGKRTIQNLAGAPGNPSVRTSTGVLFFQIRAQSPG
jgi:hypothetical protein